MTAKKKPTTRRRKTQRGKPHKDETKAQVVAALLSGAGVMETAEKFGVPHSTVSTYKTQIPAHKFDELRRDRGDELDRLVYSYLVTSLKALQAQAEVASDVEFLRQHRASELATLHGTMADRTVRVLEASTRARADQPKQLSDGEEAGEEA